MNAMLDIDIQIPDWSSDSTGEIDLDSGDRMVLYADGLVELFDGDDERLGVEGLSSLVLQAAKVPRPKCDKRSWMA
jgi:hypothetical protein